MYRIKVSILVILLMIYLKLWKCTAATHSTKSAPVVKVFHPIIFHGTEELGDDAECSKSSHANSPASTAPRNSTFLNLPLDKWLRVKREVEVGEPVLTTQPDVYLKTSEDSSNSITLDVSSSRKVENPTFFPQVNFYSTIAMSIGVLGNGLLCLRELSNIIGTPLPLWVGHIPMLMFAISLIFVPNLRPLGIPLFYFVPTTEDD